MDDLSEKEQIDQMRAWWSEYGNYVLGGIVAGVGLIVGIGQYRSNTQTTRIEASVLYETLFEAVADGDADDAESAASELFADYASTVYPSQARLAMARMYMDKGRDQDAADALRAVVDDDRDSELGLIASTRLAKVLLYQDKAQDVVDLLSNRNQSAFAARFGELLGDAHVLLGNYADANAAYLVAIADSVTMPTVDRVLVQMKLDDLPDATVAVVEAAKEAEAAEVEVDANETAETAETAEVEVETAEVTVEPAVDGVGEAE